MTSLVCHIVSDARARAWFSMASVVALLSAACASAGEQAAVQKQVINSPTVPRQAPYSTAVRSGNLIFFSGVIGTRPGGAGLPEGTEAQTRQALENLNSNLATAGVTRADVIKCTVFLVDMQDYGIMNNVYGAFFAENPPARSAVAVAALPAGARVEIECIAAVS
jgi:2-iminobutanoate/2-iminopropanoate deaminase